MKISKRMSCSFTDCYYWCLPTNKRQVMPFGDAIGKTQTVGRMSSQTETHPLVLAKNSKRTQNCLTKIVKIYIWEKRFKDMVVNFAENKRTWKKRCDKIFR